MAADVRAAARRVLGRMRSEALLNARETDAEDQVMTPELAHVGNTHV
jgi:hypothetical protein